MYDEFINLLFDGSEDFHSLAASTSWIPFISKTQKSRFEVEKLELLRLDNCFEFNAIPTVLDLNVILLKTLLQSELIDCMNLVSKLWPKQHSDDDKNCLFRITEMIAFARNVLVDLTTREDVCRGIFGIGYHQTISRIDVLRELLLREITAHPKNSLNLPKWKGRSMQFIELISIGIELDLFEGANQNEICNSLLKAFQVEAESDQPIYKQRFNALFKRSKVHLPLIANYISKVEEAKQMKVVLMNP